MPTIFTCANGHKVRVQDRDLGKTVMCPKCRAVILTAAPVTERQRPAGPKSAAADDEPLEDLQVVEEPEDVEEVLEDEDGEFVEAAEVEEVRPRRAERRPRARRQRDDEPEEDDLDEDGPARAQRSRVQRRDRAGRGDRPRYRRSNLEKVNTGLGFHYARLVLLLVGMVISMVLVIVIPFLVASRAALGGIAFVSTIISIAINFVAPMLGLVGSIFCLWVPSQARAFIIVSLVLDVLAVPVALLVSFTPFLGIGAMLVALMAVIPALLMELLSWAMFVVFLKQLSRFLGEPAMADEAGEILIWGLLLLVLGPVVMLGIIVVAALLSCFGIIVFLAAMLGYLYLLVKFLLKQLALIGSLRQVIASRA